MEDLVEISESIWYPVRTLKAGIFQPEKTQNDRLLKTNQPSKNQLHQTANANQCGHCELQNHQSVDCSKVLDVVKRKDLLLKKQLCFRYTKSGHPTKNVNLEDAQNLMKNTIGHFIKNKSQHSVVNNILAKQMLRTWELLQKKEHPILQLNL